MRVLIIVWVLTLMLFSACTGGGSSDHEETSMPRSTATIGSLSIATEVPAPVQSFHFRTDYSMVSQLPDGTQGNLQIVIEGDVVGRSTFSAEVFLSTNDPIEGPFEDHSMFVVIDDAAWKQLETEEWIETDLSDPALGPILGMIPFSVLDLKPIDLLRMTNGLPAEGVKVAGLDALYFSLTDEMRDELQNTVPQDIADQLLGGGQFVGDQAFNIGVWTSPNYEELVQLEMQATFAPERVGRLFPAEFPDGTVMETHGLVTFTRHNDPTIDVKPPVESPFAPFL